MTAFTPMRRRIGLVSASSRSAYFNDPGSWEDYAAAENAHLAAPADRGDDLVLTERAAEPPKRVVLKTRRTRLSPRQVERINVLALVVIVLLVLLSVYESALDLVVSFGLFCAAMLGLGASAAARNAGEK